MSPLPALPALPVSPGQPTTGMAPFAGVADALAPAGGFAEQLSRSSAQWAPCIDGDEGAPAIWASTARDTVSADAAALALVPDAAALPPAAEATSEPAPLPDAPSMASWLAQWSPPQSAPVTQPPSSAVGGAAGASAPTGSSASAALTRPPAGWQGASAQPTAALPRGLPVGEAPQAPGNAALRDALTGRADPRTARGIAVGHDTARPLAVDADRAASSTTIDADADAERATDAAPVLADTPLPASGTPPTDATVQAAAQAPAPQPTAAPIDLRTLRGDAEGPADTPDPVAAVTTPGRSELTRAASATAARRRGDDPPSDPTGRPASATALPTPDALAQATAMPARADEAHSANPPAFAQLLDLATQATGHGAPAMGNPATGNLGSLGPALTLDTPVQAPAFREALGVQVSVLARDGVQQAELHLNPAEMGPISVHIALDGQQAQVHFGVDNPTTRALVEAGLPELASALREAGLTLSGGGVSEHGRGQAGGAGGPPGDGGRPPGQPGPGRGGDSDTADPPPLGPRTVRLAGGIDIYA